jgi:rhodanese-related sulfurtransferase
MKLRLLLIPVALLVVYLIYQYTFDSPYRISSEEAKQLLKTHQIDVILDVRTDLERKLLGFYPGSVHIQSADLETEMKRQFPDKQLRILAYCNSGQRARAATDKLHKLGYVNAVYITSTYKTLM